jgi:hypothetical protein
MDVHDLFDRGLDALREVVAELQRTRAPVASYVLAVFDGHAKAGMSVAAAVLRDELGIDAMSADRCIDAVEKSSGSRQEPFVVAVVTDEACLVDALATSARPEVLLQLRRWLAGEAQLGHSRMVTVTGDTILATALDSATIAATRPRTHYGRATGQRADLTRAACDRMN